MERIYEILRFLIAGGFGAVVNYGILFLLTEYGGIWYITSSWIAFVVHCIVNFVTQKIWAFENTEIQKAPMQFMGYIGIAVACLIANTIILYGLVERVGIRYIPAQLSASVILTVASFGVTKRLFKK